jgi:hypothetical protein
VVPDRGMPKSSVSLWIHKLTYAVSALRPHDVTMKTALSELDRQSDCSCFVMQPKFIFLRGLFYAAWMNET